jgi:hypothetical protein
MKNLKLLLFICGIALSIGAPPLSCAVKQGDNGSGQMEDVVVKEKDTFKIEKQKPPVDITIDHMKVVLPKVETGKYFLDGLADTLEIDDLNTPPAIESEAPLSLWLHSIIDDQAVTFTLSPEKSKTESWELLITDMRGKPFKLFSGNDEIPAYLAWDGRDESGRFMQVGKVYSYIYKVKDKSGNIRTAIGKPFILEAAAHHEKRELYVSLSLNSLFESTKEGLGLSARGRLLLREAADIIKARSNSPISIRVYSENEIRAREYAKMISAFITDMLIIPENRIKCEGYREAPENFQANIIMSSGNEKRMNRYKYKVTSEFKAFKSAVVQVEPPK